MSYRDCVRQTVRRGPREGNMHQRSLSRKLLALGLCIFLVPVTCLSTAAATPAALGVVRAAGGNVLINGVPLAPGTTLFEGDRITTSANASSLVSFANGGRLAIDSLSEITVRRSVEGVSIALLSGRVVVDQDVGRQISVSLPGAEVRFVPAGSSSSLCAVALREQALVACSRGEARIFATGETEAMVVPAGFQGSSNAAAQGAPQAAHAGEVTAVIPQSRIERGTSHLPTAVKSEVLWGDLVRTEVRGRVRIGLADCSVLNVGSQSQLQVVRHDATTRQSELAMQVGKMRVQVQQLGRQGKFEVRTSTAVLDVIGTHFFVEATPTYTRVVVFEGIVRVTNILAAIAGEVDVHAGQQTLINAHQPPTSPSPTPQGVAETAMSQTEVQPGAAVRAARCSKAWIILPVAAGVATAIIIPLTEHKGSISPSGL